MMIITIILIIKNEQIVNFQPPPPSSPPPSQAFQMSSPKNVPKHFELQLIADNGLEFQEKIICQQK